MHDPGPIRNPYPGGRAPSTPPDARSLWGVCPRCETPSTFEDRGSEPVTYESGSLGLRLPGSAAYLQRVARYQCRACGQVTIVVESGYHSPQERSAKGWEGTFWWPPPGSADLQDAIPEELRDAYSEGIRSLGANAPRAAGVMFRRTVEGIVRNKGSAKAVAQLDNPDLPGALAIMAKEHTLLPTLAEWAQEVRALGNKGAHFDPIEDVTREQADDLSQLVRALLRYLYEDPDRVRRMRESRASDAEPE